MGDFLKRNWPFVAVIVVTLIASGVLVFLVLSSSAGVAEATRKLNDVKKAKNDINEFEYQLTDKNRKKAQEVAAAAWAQYEAAFNSLQQVEDTSQPQGKRPGKYMIAPTSKMSPAQAKTDVTRQVEAMRKTLGVDVEHEAVKNFTFEEIVDTDKLPDVNNIPAIMRNVMIVEEIVRLVSESGVRSFSSLERPALDLADQNGDYRYLPFKMSVSGTYPTVRKLINDIHEAEYLFIIRKLNVSGTDTIGALGEAPPANSKKHDRIVFKDLSTVKAEIEFDYVELNRAQPKTGKKKK